MKRCLGMLAFVLLTGSGLLRAAEPLSVQYYQSGVRFYQAKQYDRALGYFAASLKADASQATVYQAAGNCYLAKGDRAKALQYYDYALRLNPSNQALRQYAATLAPAAAAGPSAQSELARGHQLYRVQRYDEALQAYKQAAEIQPDSARAYQSLGNSYYALQDRGHAIEAYRKSLALDPGNRPLADFLARLDGAGPASTDVGADWVQPLWRSAILPGWGQAYNGETKKAWLLGGVTLALFAVEVGSFLVGDSARQQYLGLTDSGADYADTGAPIADRWRTVVAAD